MPSSDNAVANSSAANPSIWCPPYVMKLKTKPSLPNSLGKFFISSSGTNTTVTFHAGIRPFGETVITATDSDIEEIQVHDQAVVSVTGGEGLYPVFFFDGLDAELSDLHALAMELSLTALVEVHDRVESARAVAVGARVIGVNQRDLTTFEVRSGLAASMAPDLPGDTILVAESGIGGAADAQRAAEAGFHAVLVGETLVTAAGPRSSGAPVAGTSRRDRNLYRPAIHT